VVCLKAMYVYGLAAATQLIVVWPDYETLAHVWVPKEYVPIKAGGYDPELNSCFAPI